MDRFQSSDNVDRYDDPNMRAGNESPKMGGTYYFDKEGGAAAAGSGTAAAATATSARAGKRNWIRRHPWIAGLVALIIVIAIAVGAGVGGSMASKKSSNLASSSNGGSSSDRNGAASGSSSTATGTSSAAPAAATITPLPKWNLTDPNTKMVGVSLGNWLTLERWLDEDWFVQTAGANSWDEWTFTENLGNTKALAALQSHWDTYVTEADIDTLHSIGINSVRIPVGYWAFVDSASGEPYLSKAGQTDRLQRVLGWLYDRGMYAMIDLHGMPGSQNGDQASGHNTSTIGWFSNANVGYSYTILNTTIQWIQASNYSSVVHSVCPINEPRPDNDSGKLATLTTFYETAYTMLKDAGLIMMFHHAFVSNPMDYWQSFATGKDPNYLAYNTNPYPGWFPAVTDSSTIINAVCSLAQESIGYPVPVVMTEYSVINGVSASSFVQEYYNTQVSAYAWSGGSFFWNFKAATTDNPVLALAGDLMNDYSLTTLAENGIVAKSDTSQTALSQIKALSNQQCGTIPTPSWSNPSAQGASYSGRRKKARSKRTLSEA